MTDASLGAVRDSYDAIAAEHADLLNSDLDDRPLDRALLAAFAEQVLAGGNRSVADVGFDLWATAVRQPVRQPEGSEITERGYILARVPSPGPPIPPE